MRDPEAILFQNKSRAVAEEIKELAVKVEKLKQHNAAQTKSYKQIAVVPAETL